MHMWTVLINPHQKENRDLIGHHEPALSCALLPRTPSITNVHNRLPQLLSLPYRTYNKLSLSPSQISFSVSNNNRIWKEQTLSYAIHFFNKKMKLKPSSSRVNQNIEREPPCIMKKQRGKRQFQVRSQFSPILLSNNPTRNKNSCGFNLLLSLLRWSFSCFKQSCSWIESDQEEKARRLTVSEDHKTILQAQRERERRVCEVEVSGSSCVEESNNSIKEIQVNYASNCSSPHQNLNSRKISLETK